MMDENQFEGGRSVDKLIVERAVQALAALNCVKPVDEPYTLRLPEDKDPPISVAQVETNGLEDTVGCKSPRCAGCYDVGDGAKIHPPICGNGYKM
jgi:hypothetical protein